MPSERCEKRSMPGGTVSLVVKWKITDNCVQVSESGFNLLNRRLERNLWESGIGQVEEARHLVIARVL
jgi:hypothetical protein